MFELRGALFFGAASRLNDAFEAAFPPPRALILRFAAVPMIDASGVSALMRFLKRCAHHNTKVFVTELNVSARDILKRAGVLDLTNVREILRYEDALGQAGAEALERA
jgi:SulP family sulfate permease